MDCEIILKQYAVAWFLKAAKDLFSILYLLCNVVSDCNGGKSKQKAIHSVRDINDSIYVSDSASD